MPFVKGQSGNPNGRPKKEHSLTQILEKLGELSDVTYNGAKVSRKQALAEAIWQKAITDKDMAAIKYIYDRIDGQPVSILEMSGPGGGPIDILTDEERKAKIAALLAKMGKDVDETRGA